MCHPTHHDKPDLWQATAGVIHEDCGDDLTAAQQWALRSGIEVAHSSAFGDGETLSACCACGGDWDSGTAPTAFAILENGRTALISLFCENCLIVRGLAGLWQISSQLLDAEAPICPTHPCPGEIQ